MGRRKGILPNFGMSLFRRLTSIYPQHFRIEYSEEVLEVLAQGLNDASTAGAAAVMVFIWQESRALLVSILREYSCMQKERRREGLNEDEPTYRSIALIYRKRRWKKAGKVFGLAAVFILACQGALFAYVAFQIFRAKQHGVFPALEDAAYGLVAVEFRGAEVERLDINLMEPCFTNGKLPFIWQVHTTIFYDRNPEGYDHSVFRGYSCSYYHIKDGWVYIQGDIFPGVFGGVMQRFNLEGVGTNNFAESE